jgi:hypothetical protein
MKDEFQLNYEFIKNGKLEIRTAYFDNRIELDQFLQDMPINYQQYKIVSIYKKIN